MAATVTLLADHKGIKGPKAIGDEYVVDAYIDLGAYASGGIDVTASQFGLSTMHQLIITGQDSTILLITPEVSATGAYESSTTITINAIDEQSNQLAEENSTQDCGTIRVRVYGLI